MRLRVETRSRRRGLPSTGLGTVLFALFVAMVACGDHDVPPGRVLLVGIDGATLRVAGPLLEEGRLPHLASIARDGVSGPLQSIKPMLSPRIWNSIATGKTPPKHGIVGFALKDAEGRQQLLLSTDRKVHALWNVATRMGLTSVVVNWWNTYPPERIDGVMVSDHLLAKEIEGRQRLTNASAPPGGALVHPETWQPRLSELLRERVMPVAFGDPLERGDELPEWVNRQALSRWFWQDAALTRFAAELEASLQPDLLMVLLTGIDRNSHLLWGNLEPAKLYPPRLHPSPTERAAGAAALRRYYEYTDALLGVLLDRYGPDDLVLVVSDHGFEAGVELGSLTGTHKSDAAIEGVLFARGRGIPAGDPAGDVSVLDVTPTILAWLGLPVALDMDGAVAGFVEERSDRIESWDTEPIERVSSAPSGADAVLIEQLRELGYIE
jgi:hypothetical protein